MKKLLLMAAILSMSGCAAPKVITGNSRSVVVDDGQYMGHDGLITSGMSEVSVKEEADKWCAKYGRVSGAEIPHFPPSRRREFECVSK